MHQRSAFLQDQTAAWANLKLNTRQRQNVVGDSFLREAALHHRIETVNVIFKRSYELLVYPAAIIGPQRMPQVDKV